MFVFAIFAIPLRSLRFKILVVRRTDMKVGLFLILMLQVLNLAASTSVRLTEQERAALFVVREEATDYALEARTDVCVEFDTRSELRGSAILDALQGKSFKFHEGSWCNHSPRGVTIFIETPQGARSPSGPYEFVASVSDSDPIRLFGEYFATLLRKSKYVIKCESGSEPVVDSYQMLCCKKSSSQLGASAH
jgi:hypothetical protein